MDKAGLQAAFKTAGLSRVLKDIDLVAQASIRLYTTPVDESTLTVGASKLGGLPDLPAGVTWPVWQELPQSFIAQVRLDDAHAADTSKLLPASGMLWFFYDAQQKTYGAGPADAGGWSVLYSLNPSGLKRTPAPAQLPATSRFHACSIRYASELTLSQQPKLEIPNCDWTDAEQKQYETLLSTFPTPADHAAIHHRMLGFPDLIQDDTRQQSQLASHGVTSMNDPRAADLLKVAKDWLLLLQVDSDEHAGMAWGDTGMLYYSIVQSDLQAQHFDHTWLVLQSE